LVGVAPRLRYTAGSLGERSEREMLTFTVGVEIHNVEKNHPSYKKVHEIMEAKKFRRTFKDAKGAFLLLPHAEYLGESDRDADAVAREVHGLISHLADDIGVIATPWGYPIGAAGRFKDAPTFHLPFPNNPGIAMCRTPYQHEYEIRDDLADAKQGLLEIGGGRFCPYCFGSQ
jgi:hypothetical protein